MGFSKSGQSMVVASARTDKKSGQMLFKVMRKEGDEWIVPEGHIYDSVDGELVGITIKTKPNDQGKEIVKLYLGIKGVNPFYPAEITTLAVNFNFNFPVRSLINRMYSAWKAVGIEGQPIELWCPVPEQPTHTNIALKLAGQRWERYYAKEDLPEVDVVKNKRGEVIQTDDYEVNQFFIQLVEEMADDFKANCFTQKQEDSTGAQPRTTPIPTSQKLPAAGTPKITGSVTRPKAEAQQGPVQSAATPEDDDFPF